MDTKIATKYACPMHCEGEKTYTEPGDCPVCGMHLVHVDELNKEKKDSHQGKKPQHAEHEGKYYCPMRCEGDKTYDEPGDCPVCGMHLVLEEDGQKSTQKEHKHAHHHAHKHEHSKTSGKGKYYCPMRCEGDKTYDEPGDCPVCGMHLNKEESSSPSNVVYTCPMHPEVKQDHPGNCPKCGMELIPEKGVEPSEEEKAYKKMA
ncbi:MAG TPA: heavy metal-binding domain-containing protein, partial [Sunxiuqinia sp.]|nr:heavy metal-binding domain-containing protein [Sunxiuqinia sp.]